MKKFKKSNQKIPVLLVASPKTDLGFNRAVRVPHLGLNSIAANLDRSICDVRVLDLVAAGRNPRHYFQRYITRYRPALVGFSCMTFQYKETLALARITKLVDKNIIVVIGGYHPTVAADRILNNEEDMQVIDFLSRNEGEIAFNKLITTLYNGGDIHTVPNLSFIEDGSIVNTPEGDVVNLDQIKPPDRSVRVIKRGFHVFASPGDVFETSRGCTSNCDFCSMKIMYGRRFRKYSIERVVRDIMDARERGAKALFAADDNITLDGPRYLELCRAIIDAGIQLKFFIQAGIRGLFRTPDLISTMVRSGVKWVFLGIENVADSNLRFLDKSDQFKSDEVFEVVTELRRRKVLVIGGFIIGNPDDSRETIRANYEYAKKLKLDFALFFILTPFPRTEIRDKLMTQGLITNPDDFTRYTCFEANVKTKYLSSKELYSLREEMGYRYPLDSGSCLRLVREFVSHPFYYTLHFGFGQLLNDPLELFGYLKGLRGKI